MILTAVLNWLTGGFVDKVVDLGKAYFAKEISEEQFRSEVAKSANETAAKVEASWAEATAKTAASTADMVRSSAILQRAWSAVLFLEVFVLFWYQIAAPAFELITGVRWPDPGISLTWAYLLVGAQLGAGPLVFRRGPAQ